MDRCQHVCQQCGKYLYTLNQLLSCTEPLHEEIARLRAACNAALHAALLRALDEAGIKNEVLRGMCVEVAIETFEDELDIAALSGKGEV